MESLYVAAGVLGLIILFLGLGVWVFSGLLLVSIVGLAVFIDMPLARIGTILGPIMIRSSTGWELSAIPMFVWMGEIILRTDISTRLFRGLSPLTYHLPGRLLHTNIAGSAIFAAICGSSAATTATVGKITVPELERRGYQKALTYGSLAGAGSLGLLIPPSIIMIVYGVIAEVSIARLFAAGILPGIMIAGFYSTYIMIVSLLFPSVAPAEGERPTAGDMLRGVVDLMPIGLLITLVLGAIYSGIATPSETAAVGVGVTMAYTAVTGQMNRKVFRESLFASVHTSCMISAIMISAAFMSTAMGFMHVPQDISAAISQFDLSPFALIALLTLLYIVLGMFLEGVSMTVMSLPITLPLIMAAGFDPIWFGIFLILMIELAQITPPIGFNLFILQDLTRTSITRIIVAASPFFLLMCVGVLCITVWPEIVLWLPDQLYSK
ncbi:MULTISPECIES: TRAP transporter large permease [Roseobacteraceae]|uniref:TRAP transporter large permease protein n=1 Tax=Pseudosulfitobacter pseudonitzschiae TaxID=1402135 RepID=A0A221K7R0_9RHOB|nr:MULTISPECIES: TRAP transporter large permease subunit [Roseobacteraceae]ASM75041.1 C4-dicarboxylate TRAP transporter large permease protein DctM [Pseudosulfitobacter pseudonitzschiae]